MNCVLSYLLRADSMLANEKLQMDLGHFKLEFINGRWKEQGAVAVQTSALLTQIRAGRPEALDSANGGG